MIFSSAARSFRLDLLRHRAGLLAATLALLLPLSADAQEVQPREEPVLPAPLVAAMEAAGSVQPRIVGGSDVGPGAFRRNFRWMASLQYDGVGHFCGASIILRRWALTAAHCVMGLLPSQFSLLLGTRQLSDGGSRVRVSGVVIHPDYDPATFDNDIALLRLDEGVGGPKANLASRAVTNNLAPRGTRATIIGWGNTSEGGQGADILQRTRVPIVGQARCRDNYWWRQIPNTMICAGWRQGGRDSCQGDSGGPMAVQDDQGDWVQVGVASFGVGCARPDFPGVYARVGAFHNYINQVTEGRGRACYDQSWPSHFRTPRDFECHSFRGFLNNSVGPIRIGFPVQMGDTVYRELYISNNGAVTFDSELAQPRNLRSFDQVDQPIIAPYWNDIDTFTDGEGMLHYGRAVINGRRAFMVIWQEVPAWGSLTPGANTFQLVLIEPDRSHRRVHIEFNYARIEYNLDGAYVGFSAGPGGPARTVDGSGNSLSFVDGAGNALVSASNNGTPGRMSWRLRRGNNVR